MMMFPFLLFLIFKTKAMKKIITTVIWLAIGGLMSNAQVGTKSALSANLSGNKLTTSVNKILWATVYNIDNTLSVPAATGYTIQDYEYNIKTEPLILAGDKPVTELMQENVAPNTLPTAQLNGCKCNIPGFGCRSGDHNCLHLCGTYCKYWGNIPLH
jgi:hypothetical protein